MSTRLRCFLLFMIVMVATTAFGDPTIVNPNFGAVLITCSNYAYQGTDGCGNASQDFNSAPGFGWTLGPTDPQWRGSGLTGPNSAFNPPPFTGMPFTQAVFLQGINSSVSQEMGIRFPQVMPTYCGREDPISAGRTPYCGYLSEADTHLARN